MTSYQESLNMYQALFAQYSQSAYLNYPHSVQLESLTLCPAACSFCPYPGLERQGTRMSDHLIDKVIQDLTEIPRQLPFNFLPYKVNEPFADSRLISILKRVNQSLPNALISLISSSAPLTEKKLNELLEIQNIHLLIISLNDYRPEEYQKLMKLPWERTFERLSLLHRYQEQGLLPFPIQLWRVGDRSVHDQYFVDWCRQQLPLFQASSNPRGDWIGQVSDLDGLDPRIPPVSCLHWFELSITATGVVSLCCMDGEAKWPIGDVNQQHVLDIYNQADYRRLREQKLLRTQLMPCKQCNYV